MFEEKSRPGAGTPERAVENLKESIGQHTFNFNYIRESGENQVSKFGRVWDLLGAGKENAQTGANLRDALGVDDIRVVSKAVEAERHAGFPIIATTDPTNPGYFRPGDLDEFDSYLRSFDSRLRHMKETRDRLQETRDDLAGQEVIAGWNRFGEPVTFAEYRLR